MIDYERERVHECKNEEGVGDPSMEDLQLFV